MHYFIYPTKDATLYRNNPIQNTGLDEVLEVAKVVYPPTVQSEGSAGTYTNIREISRALLKWDISEISESIAADIITSPRFYLNLKVCAAEEIPFEYTINVHAVSQSWEMGVGTKYDKVTTDGVSWLYRDNAESDGELWRTDLDATASLDNGGTWHTGSELQASQSFSYSTGDMRVDVTDIMNAWLSGTVPNEGVIVKHTGEVEQDSKDYGILQFFSIDTSTIYSPRLEIAWDDSVYSTGSLQELTHEDIVLYMKNLKSEYKEDSRVKFRVVARERIPAKTFSTGSQYVTVKYLPEATFYYSIRDAETNNVMVPFSEYTKISCDDSGPYFMFWMDGLQSERYYEITYKVVRDGTIEYFSNNFTFKLVR